ncbi:hypothetical protein [Iningainema tapete]|uniref:Uncharacterized protein n=1 Tax=Iningainema tapete BLCC-T55 TaxID=2748662 RepID=A0A8J7C408_9CYAN|nr:hypothetical protein [Iningainema tapete]MBD2770759.1 hypothetical protein [Iningainema tapete BLCC-T55]
MQPMKTLRTLAPITLGLLTLTVTSSVSAQAVIDRLNNGNLSVTGMTPGSGCTVLFNPQGELLQNGQSCSSREIGKAQTAIDSYLREQGTFNGSSSRQEGLTLICYGEGRKPSIESRNGYEWNERRHRYVLRNRIESSKEDFDSQVQVEIRDMQGRIHLTGKLIAPINSGGSNGWWTLDDLKVTPERITGRYRMNGLNKPRVTIDRRSGQIAIDGIERFRGTCDSGDWGSSRNRF